MSDRAKTKPRRRGVMSGCEHKWEYLGDHEWWCKECDLVIELTPQIWEKLKATEEERDEAMMKVGDLSEKLKRLLYITGQLTMLRHKDSEEYETLHAEYISMKFPEFIQKEGGAGK